MKTNTHVIHETTDSKKKTVHIPQHPDCLSALIDPPNRTYTKYRLGFAERAAGTDLPMFTLLSNLFHLGASQHTRPIYNVTAIRRKGRGRGAVAASYLLCIVFRGRQSNAEPLSEILLFSFLFSILVIFAFFDKCFWLIFFLKAFSRFPRNMTSILFQIPFFVFRCRAYKTLICSP